MNNVVLIGRLVRDPELRYSKEGVAVANFTLAVEKPLAADKKAQLEQENKPTADFIDVVAWGKSGENVANYLSKGRLVAVAGRIETSSYTDKENIRRKSVDIRANSVKFLDYSDEGQGGQGGANQGGGYQQPQQGYQAPQQPQQGYQAPQQPQQGYQAPQQGYQQPQQPVQQPQQPQQPQQTQQPQGNTVDYNNFF